MRSFTYQNPTKIYFGEGVVKKLGAEVAKYGKNALFVYGKESIKKSGLYDLVKGQLSSNGVKFVEHGGVKANPSYKHTREGVEKARAAGVDVVVAVGGGSVVDESKAIALTLAGVDFWDVLAKGAPVTACLPVVDVMTMPATGSEMNGCFVITKEETLEKFGTGGGLASHPRASFLDPTYTLTISQKQTAYAASDMMSHLMEGYMTTEREVVSTCSYIEGVLRSVIACAKTLAKNPRDLDARANIMWSATLAWNGTGLLGLENNSLPCHSLEHAMSAVYDIAHGAGLAMVTPAWMKFKADKIKPRLLSFAKNVLGIDCAGDEKLAIRAFEDLLSDIGAPLTWAQVGVENPDNAELAKHAAKLFAMDGESQQYPLSDLKAIFDLIPNK